MSSAEKALLYARTLRHLRSSQLVYQPLRRLQLRIAAGEVAREVPVRPFESAGAVVRRWGSGRARAGERANAVLDGSFRFLNHTEQLGQIDWRRRYVSHLWSYNLQYFDYAVDLAAAAVETGDRRYTSRLGELALGWIDGSASGRGDGWEPYALSLRVVNWAYALWSIGGGLDSQARRAMDSSMGAQLAYLEKRLELHILANHLQKNYKALAVGGLYFAGPDAERWLRKGIDGLWRELFEQFLPDGTHYERSPMYHAIALGDYLEVLDLLDAAAMEVPAAVRDRVRAAARAFGVLSRPDGSSHLFNDAAHGIAPDRAWLDRMSRRVLGEGIPDRSGVVSLPEGGYYGVIDPGAGERILIDCGEPGPSYQPGHAHCDLLSFELDLERRPVVVDAGVSGYDGDPFREYVRSTRAHNTVSIGGRDQSEVWGTFRMARRPRVGSAVQSGGAAEYRFEGSYSPYHNRRAEHHRRIERLHGGWRVTDQVRGVAGAPLISYLHLHPDFEVDVRDGMVIARDSAGLQVVIEPFGVDSVRVARGEREPVQGWHCPEFGVAVPAAAIEMRVEHNAGRKFGYLIRKRSGT